MVKKYSREQKAEYGKKRYKKLHSSDPDYKNKKHLKVMLTKYVKLNRDDLMRLPRKVRKNRFRYQFQQMPGTIEIPVELCHSNHEMAQYCARYCSSGIYNMKAGYQHRRHDRVTWRGLITFEVIEDKDGTKHVYVKKVWNERLRHYWFRKR
jgi:hypothetical protein